MDYFRRWSICVYTSLYLCVAFELKEKTNRLLLVTNVLCIFSNQFAIIGFL